MTEGYGCEVLTDAVRAVWEPLIEEVKPRVETRPQAATDDLGNFLATPEWAQVARHPG
jgi:hypothetical protein